MHLRRPNGTGVEPRRATQNSIESGVGSNAMELASLAGLLALVLSFELLIVFALMLLFGTVRLALYGDRF